MTCLFHIIKVTVYFKCVLMVIFIVIFCKSCVVIIFLYFTDSRPQTVVLLSFLSSICAKWQEIGDLLGVDSDWIDKLAFSNSSDQVKMSKMLQSWLDNEPTPTTWGNIISIIEGPLQKKQLAAEILQFLNLSM